MTKERGKVSVKWICRMFFQFSRHSKQKMRIRYRHAYWQRLLDAFDLFSFPNNDCGTELEWNISQLRHEMKYLCEVCQVFLGRQQTRVPRKCQRGASGLKDTRTRNAGGTFLHFPSSLCRTSGCLRGKVFEAQQRLSTLFSVTPALRATSIAFFTFSSISRLSGNSSFCFAFQLI